MKYKDQYDATDKHNKLEEDINDLNKADQIVTSKTKEDTRFDPTKANVNGTSLDDEEGEDSDEKQERETDDSRRSSYDTAQKRRGSVHGGYRQPIPSTNVQQHPSNKDGLDSRDTDAASLLKDSGYSDQSRFETPDDNLGTASSTDYDSSTPFDRQRQKEHPMIGRRKTLESSTDDPPSGILKTIVDDYDETKEDDYYHRVFKDRCGIPLEIPEPRMFNDSYGFPLDVPDEDDEATTIKGSGGYRNGNVKGGKNIGGVGYAPDEMPVLEKHSNIYLKDVRSNLGPEVDFQPEKRPIRGKPNLISPDYLEGQDR